MINSTFTIFPGIGERSERHLWESGVFTWDDFLGREGVPGFSAARKAGLDGYVRTAAEALNSGDTRYFIPLLGAAGRARQRPLATRPEIHPARSSRVLR